MRTSKGHPITWEHIGITMIFFITVFGWYIIIFKFIPDIYKGYFGTPLATAAQDTVVFGNYVVPENSKYFYCVANDMNAMVKTYIVDSLPGDAVGRYYPDAEVILLEKIDIRTVAHEVSHYVDDMTVKRQIHDGETRAYMQGYFTECVWEGVQSATWVQIGSSTPKKIGDGVKLN